MNYTATDEIFLVTKPDGSESRHIRADRLFSGVANDWYVLVNENGVTSRCLVSELIAKASDDRYMLVNTSEQVTAFAGPITQVFDLTTPFYEDFLQVVDDNNNPYNGPWWDEAIHGDEEDVFDGDLSTEFKRTGPRYQDKEIRMLFTPATPIEVKNRIDVMCGFASFAPVGEVYINGNLALTYTLSDTDPKVWNGVDFTGTLTSLMIRQRDYNPVDQADALTLSGIKIDDVLLVSNQSNTYLECADSTGFEHFHQNMFVIETDASQNVLDGVGQVQKIETNQNRIVLNQIEPNWDVGNFIRGPVPATTRLGTDPTWSDYVKIIDDRTGGEYTGGYRFNEGPPSNVFDGHENTFMYRVPDMQEQIYFEFTPPTPINVSTSIDCFVGVHSDASLGEIIINDNVVSQFNSSDLNPVWCVAPFSGEVNKLAVRQVNPDPSIYRTKTFTISALRVDNQILIDDFEHTGLPNKSYKIKSSIVAFAGQGFIWSDHAKILDERTGNEYTGSLINPTGSITDCFDGSDSTWIYRAATITGATPQLYFEFIPPFPIRVNQSIEVLAGFHSTFDLGEIIVNGTPIGEFNAADGSPQWGSGLFTGTINSLVVKQKVAATDTSNGMKTISLGAIKIDGDYIIDGQPI